MVDVDEINQSDIIRRGIEALGNIDFNINKILSLHPAKDDVPPDGGFMISDPEIVMAVQELCASQSFTYSCLFDNSRKRSSESPLMYELRLLRVERIRAICEGIDLTHIRNKGFRNAIAHFDERLLSKIIEFHGHPHNGLENIGLSKKGMISFPAHHKVYIIRVYYYEEDEFWLFYEHIKLKPLQSEIDCVLKSLGLELDKADRRH